MKVLAIYAVNEHINQLMVDAHHARIARAAAPVRPSLVRRVARAARAAFVRLSPQMTGAGKAGRCEGFTQFCWRRAR